MNLVVKIGTSSVVSASGEVDASAIAKLSRELAQLQRASHRVVLVTSGAVASGVHAIRRHGAGAVPSDPAGMQALSAIGQHRLMRVYDDALAAEGLLTGQVLLAPLDFGHRSRYLHARDTLSRLLDLGVMPIVNENDAIADDEIRFGDNDRLAALVAHLMRSDLLVILTDTAGLFSADPRLDGGATLIEEVAEVDHALEAAAGGPGSESATGGMASKLSAAKMAAWSGARCVIAAADRPEVLSDAVAGETSVGTLFLAHERSLSARKLWIAFALRPAGRIAVDAGAKTAIVERDASLLAAGVREVTGRFAVDDAVEIAGPDGTIFAKGIVRLGTDRAREWVGRRSSEVPAELAGEVVHRDDLVVLDD